MFIPKRRMKRYFSQLKEAIEENTNLITKKLSLLHEGGGVYGLYLWESESIVHFFHGI